MTYLSEPPVVPVVSTILQAPPAGGSYYFEGSRVSDSYWSEAANFEARKGQPNVWSVRLPDELTRALREQLEAETKK